MDLGSILFIVALAYGLGVLWYDLLPVSVSSKVWRLAAYPFLGIFAAEALLAPSFKTWDWSFGGIHLVTVLIGSLVAVVVDWAIQQVRHPAMAPQPQRSVA